MRSRLVTLAALGLGLLTASLAGAPGHARAQGPSQVSGPFSGPHVDAQQAARDGAAALQAGAYAYAEDAFKHVTYLKPGDADAWYNLGEAATGLGHTTTAEHAYARAVALAPSSIQARRGFAVTLARMKQTQKAAAQLDALKALAAACNDRCPQADELRGAVATVESALKA